MHHRLRLLAFPVRTRDRPVATPKISRFPNKERPHMPGSQTTPDRWRHSLTRRSVLPSTQGPCRHPGSHSFAAQWLAYALPCQRFADGLTTAAPRDNSGPVWIATPSPYRTLTCYSLPVSPAATPGSSWEIRVHPGSCRRFPDETDKSHIRLPVKFSSPLTLWRIRRKVRASPQPRGGRAVERWNSSARPDQ